MKSLTLYIGHNVNGKQTHDEQTVIKALDECLQLEAYTILQARGVWRCEAENTSVVIISLKSNEETEEIINALPTLAETLNQQEILYELTTVQAAYVARTNNQETKQA